MTGISKSDAPAPDAVIDVSGLDCPVPATEARKRLDCMKPGQILEVIATDPLAAVDLQILCDRSGHVLLDSREQSKSLTVWIRVSAGRRPDAD